MSGNIIKSGPQVRQEMKEGVDVLANMVKITLGPKGLNVLIMNGNEPEIINDGVSIAKKVYIGNPIQNAAASLIKQVCQKTDDNAGDGTTTATILAQAILHAGMSLENVNYLKLKKAFENIYENIESYLSEKSQKIKSKEDIYSVAMVSTNGDKMIAKLISDAFEQLGNDCYLITRESPEYLTYLKTVEGLKYDKGYVNPFLTNDKTDRCARYNTESFVCYISGEVSEEIQLVPILELAASFGAPILIIAQKIYGEALTFLIRNKMQANIALSAVEAPGITSEQIDMMADMISVTGGTILNTETGLQTLDPSLNETCFGRVAGFEVHKDYFVLHRLESTAETEEAIAKRIEHIETEMQKYKHTKFEQSAKGRIAKLKSGIGIIYAGGYSPAEVAENKLRIQDAINAVMCAVEDGYVPGGGISLLRAAVHIKANYLPKSKEETQALEILCASLTQPFYQILENCGHEKNEIDKISREIFQKPFSYGYDAWEEKVVDMYQAGIMNATKVDLTGLKNAISIASIILSSGGAVITADENPQQEKKMQTPGFFIK